MVWKFGSWWRVLLTPIRSVARFCSRLILVTVFMYIVQGKNGLPIIYGRKTRKETAYIGGLRRIQEAPDRQLHGQVWFGTINSIMALNRKGMGTWRQCIKNRLMVHCDMTTKVVFLGYQSWWGASKMERTVYPAILSVSQATSEQAWAPLRVPPKRTVMKCNWSREENHHDREGP